MQSKSHSGQRGGNGFVLRGAIMFVGLTVCFVWSYWTTLGAMANKWAHEAAYSHGYLVPLIALGLLWVRFERLQMGRPRPRRWAVGLLLAGATAGAALPAALFTIWGFVPVGVAVAGACLLLWPSGSDSGIVSINWWGVPILLAAAGLRWVGVYFYMEWFDWLSLVPSVLGLCVLFGGRRVWNWCWPGVGFLVFMVPLPYTLEVMLRGPLRSLGTVASTYAMQTAGLPAIAEGHIVTVGEFRIGVAEACSGLNMLMIFVALSTAVALVIDRPLWQRAVVLCSAVPIALVANIARIVATGILHVTVGSEMADFVFHDLAGYLMILLALGLLGAELWLLSRLIIVDEEEPVAVGLPSGAARRRDESEASSPMAP